MKRTNQEEITEKQEGCNISPEKLPKTKYVSGKNEIDKVEDEISSYWDKFENQQSMNILISKASLYLLIEECGKGCECGGKWVVDLEKSHDSGHAHLMFMRCSNISCKNSCKWNSSKKFKDGTYDINRRAVASWILTGGEGQDKYIEFMKVWGVGHIPCTSWYCYQEQLAGCVSDVVLSNFQKLLMKKMRE